MKEGWKCPECGTPHVDACDHGTGYFTGGVKYCYLPVHTPDTPQPTVQPHHWPVTLCDATTIVSPGRLPPSN
jgi:hypothetical protein